MIVAAVLAVFVRALEAGFVEWDDNIIYDNPHTRGLDWGRIRWMFTDMQYLWRYMPLTWLSWAIDHYREVLTMDPKDSSSYNNLGAAVAAQGKLEEAVCHLTEASPLPRFAQETDRGVRG